MKTRAAVAFEAKKPLEIVELDLEGPKAAKCWSRSWRPVSVIPMPTRSMAWTARVSSRAFSAMRGAGIVREVGAGVTSVKPGDHVIPLYTPECRQCKSCLSGKTNLCTAIRATQGKGLMPDGTSRFSYKGQTVYHYMGCSTFSNFTVLPEIAVAKIREDAPFKTSCYIGCGVTTGVGAVVKTAKVEPGSNIIVFGLGGIGLNVLQGAKMVGADKIIGVDINDAREEWGPQVRHDPLRQPEQGFRRSRSPSGRADRRRRRLHLRLHRQHAGHAYRARGLPSRLGHEHRPSAWRRRARKSARGHSSSLPAATGAAPPLVAPRAVPTYQRSSTGT